jgi:hypothetical protein
MFSDIHFLIKFDKTKFMNELNSKTLRSFKTVNDAVKVLTKRGFGIRKVVMAWSKEHTLKVGSYSVNVNLYKDLKKGERADLIEKLLKGKESKLIFEKFEIQLTLWNQKGQSKYL